MKKNKNSKFANDKIPNLWDNADMKKGMLTDELARNTLPLNNYDVTSSPSQVPIVRFRTRASVKHQ